MITVPRRRHGWRMVAAQIGGVAALLGGLALVPPADGNLLLLPLLPHRAVAALAVARGALIVAHGPTANSLVVRGRYAVLAGPLLAEGVLAVGAPALLCGDAVPA